MCTGAHPAYMQMQVDRVRKEIGEHFDLASAMAVDGFAAVFGTVLERRAEGSRKRPRYDAIQASESPVTGLGVPSQDSGPREDAEKAIKAGKKVKENMLAYWTPEVANQPARVTVIDFPSRSILRQKNLFNVSEVRSMDRSTSSRGSRVLP